MHGRQGRRQLPKQQMRPGEGNAAGTLGIGQRVGVGWHGGQDNTCPACRRGDFRNCANVRVPGISYDGGYAEYMIAPVEALAAMPDGLNPVEAAPLLCAGITTFNALRHSGAVPGDLVAVQGIGGLGHHGIQFANKIGDRGAAVGRGGAATKRRGAGAGGWGPGGAPGGSRVLSRPAPSPCGNPPISCRTAFR